MKNVTVFRVTAGSVKQMYFAEHHAEQMARALRMNGMTPVIDIVRLPDDALTRLSVQS